jgi:hypothetical protein
MLESRMSAGGGKMISNGNLTRNHVIPTANPRKRGDFEDNQDLTIATSRHSGDFS